MCAQALLSLLMTAGFALAVDLEVVKLDLSILSPDQQRNLALQITTDAHFESRLENCGFKPDFERRAIEAITACLTPETVDRLKSFYRSAKERQSKFIAEAVNKTGPERIDCASDYEKNWLKKVSKDLDDDVVRLDRMCRACPVCRN
jgi:hypothetical protein